MRSIALLSLAAAALLLGGCANNTTPIVPPGPATPAEQNFELVWQSSLDVLTHYGWRIDRVDRREGIIATYPMTAKQWFEFWRHDTANWHQTAESSLQTIYQRVEVTLVPTRRDPAQYDFQVQVFVMRSENPSRQLITAQDIYGQFILPGRTRRSGEFILEREEYEDPNAAVSNLGRNSEMEDKLAVEISNQVSGRQVRGEALHNQPPAPQPAAESIGR